MVLHAWYDMVWHGAPGHRLASLHAALKIVVKSAESAESSVLDLRALMMGREPPLQRPALSTSCRIHH